MLEADNDEEQSKTVGSPWMKQHIIYKEDCMLMRGVLATRDHCPCGLKVSNRKYGEVVVPDGKTAQDVCVFRCNLPQGTTVITQSEEKARGDIP